MRAALLSLSILLASATATTEVTDTTEEIPLEEPQPFVDHVSRYEDHVSFFEPKKPVAITEGVVLNLVGQLLLRALSSLNIVKLSDTIPQEGQAIKAFIPDYADPSQQTNPLLHHLVQGLVDPEQKQAIIGIGIGGPNQIGFGGFNQGLVAVVGFLALVGAGVAAILGFLVPPLQIANQVLAIIALAMLCAYIFEDKNFAKHYDYDPYYQDYGYDNQGYKQSSYNSYGSSSSYGGGSYGYDRADRPSGSDTFKYSAKDGSTSSSSFDGVRDPYDYSKKVNDYYNRMDYRESEIQTNSIVGKARSIGVSLLRSFANFALSGADTLRHALSPRK